MQMRLVDSCTRFRYEAHASDFGEVTARLTKMVLPVSQECQARHRLPVQPFQALCWSSGNQRLLLEPVQCFQNQPTWSRKGRLTAVSELLMSFSIHWHLPSSLPPGSIPQSHPGGHTVSETRYTPDIRCKEQQSEKCTSWGSPSLRDAVTFSLCLQCVLYGVRVLTTHGGDSTSGLIRLGAFSNLCEMQTGAMLLEALVPKSTAPLRIWVVAENAIDTLGSATPLML